MSGARTTAEPAGWLTPAARRASARPRTGLVILWSYAEPERVGEVAFVPEREPSSLGRGPGEPDGALRLRFVRQRPGGSQDRPALAGDGLSREQLLLNRTDGRLNVECVGRSMMRINGTPQVRRALAVGDTIGVEGALLLWVVERDEPLPALLHYPTSVKLRFGEADAHGLVGESPAIWALRDELAYAAASPGHVLIRGESGTGKELAAQAIHALSLRGARRLVSRSAATVPAGLIDAELFGNIKDYPNPGMPERPGLIGEADKSTLFLDEVGELPVELQARLLRVLDGEGEYQRLGEARTRRADLRLVAATNRPLEALKHDLLARFSLRIELPPLSARPEDVPLLVSQLLRALAAVPGSTAARVLGETHPRVDPALIDALVRGAARLNVRSLQRLLLLALRDSQGAFVALTPAVVEALGTQAPQASTPSTLPESLTAAELHQAIADAGGNKTAAAKALGLSSRLVLHRLLKRLGGP